MLECHILNLIQNRKLFIRVSIKNVYDIEIAYYPCNYLKKNFLFLRDFNMITKEFSFRPRKLKDYFH